MASWTGRWIARDGRWNGCPPANPTGTYTDPTVRLEGRDALVQHITGFLKGLPGAKIVTTSRADVHHGMLRFTWRIVKADGSTLSEGMDFGELDADGRIRTIVGFFGPFSRLDP